MNEEIAREIRQLLEEKADNHAKMRTSDRKKQLQYKAQLQNYNTSVYTALITYMRQRFKYNISRSD